MARLIEKVMVPDGGGTIIDDPYGFLETVAGAGFNLGEILLVPDEMPEWAAEAAAMMIAANVGFGAGPQAYLDNLNEAARIHDTLNISRAEASRVFARGLEAIGRTDAVAMLRDVARHLDGEPVELDKLARDVSPSLDPVEEFVELGKFLMNRVELEPLPAQEIFARQRAAVDAIPEAEYFERAARADKPSGMPMYPLFADAQVRFYRNLPTTAYGGKYAFFTLNRRTGALSEVPRLNARRLATSAGEIHFVIYRDQFVLRSVDGVDLAARPSPRAHMENVPSAVYWTRAEAPDWRLEEIDGGAWVAAYRD